jgi:hypothetical protein
MNAAPPRTITIDDDSEFGRALDAYPHEPITLLKGGRRYRVVRAPDDIWADYGPERIRKALEEVAGTLSPEFGDQIKEDIRRARHPGCAPTRQTAHHPSGIPSHYPLACCHLEERGVDTHSWKHVFLSTPYGTPCCTGA